MPVFIEEVFTEVNEPVPDSPPPAEQTPLSVAEIELAQTLALIKQRQDRLRVD